MRKNLEIDPDKKSKEGFISRWSRRKADVANMPERDVLNAVGKPQSTGEVMAQVNPNPAQTVKTKQDSNQEKDFTDKDMPPLDSLAEDSDFSMFMSPGVSDTLRNLALRKLFSGASFNIRDGLDDYDDDFRTFAALGDLVTCDMKHHMEMEDDRKHKQEEIVESVAESDLEETDQDDIQDDIDESTPEGHPADQGLDAKAESVTTVLQPVDGGESKKTDYF